MHDDGSESKMSPPDLPERKGAEERGATTTAAIGVPGQRGWRERLKDLMEG